MRTHRLWNVEIQLLTAWPGSSASVRAFICPAALLVKVTARMRSEGTPWSRTRWAMRWVMTRVLPLPAPARMRTAPSVASTASRCCGLSPANSGDSPVAGSTEPELLKGLNAETAERAEIAEGPERLEDTSDSNLCGLG